MESVSDSLAKNMQESDIFEVLLDLCYVVMLDCSLNILGSVLSYNEWYMSDLIHVTNKSLIN